MECCVKYTDLWHIRKNSSHSLDAKDVGRVVKRREYRALLELYDYSISNELAAYEFLCAVNHTVTYSFDILECGKNTVFLVKKGFKVYNLDKGILNWMEEGREVEK